MSDESAVCNEVYMVAAIFSCGHPDAADTMPPCHNRFRQRIYALSRDTIGHHRPLRLSGGVLFGEASILSSLDLRVIFCLADLFTDQVL